MNKQEKIVHGGNLTDKEKAMPIEAFAEKLYFECGIEISYDNYLQWLQENDGLGEIKTGWSNDKEGK